MDDTKSIVIIEDHPVMQEGLLSYFEKTGKWRVTGTAASLEKSKELLCANTPDVILLDIQLEDEPGLNIIPWLKNQRGHDSLPVIAVYTSYNDFVHASAALGRGVQVYMCKKHSVNDLEKALCGALNGKIYIDESVQSKLDSVAGILNILTKREAEIFAMVKSGCQNRQIAQRLNISHRTVENILCCIYDKTGVHSREKLRDL